MPYEVVNNGPRRTILFRAHGVISEQEMERAAHEYRVATDFYEGGKHLVLADMRGLKTFSPQVAALFGEAISYGRMHGVVRCAHVSDLTIQRLQALRVARQAAGSDEVTVDVDSLEEAERVLQDARVTLITGPASGAR